MHSKTFVRLSVRAATIVWVCFFLSACANPLFFYPDSKTYQTPSDVGLPYEEVTFFSKDKTELSGWFVPALKSEKVSKAKGTIIHFHGNAQNMSAHFSFVDWLPEKGYNLFLFDYRGYGLSKGRPYRSGLYEDCLAALAVVMKRDDVDPEKAILLGQSLGGSLALRVVSDHPEFGVRAVITDSAFASYRMIVKDKIGMISLLKWIKYPLSFLFATDGYSPVDAIEKLSPVPVLIIHGTEDRVVPFYHGELLFEKAKKPKQIWRIENGRHTDVFSLHRMKYRRKILDYIDTIIDL